jgi:ribonuclease T1
MKDKRAAVGLVLAIIAAAFLFWSQGGEPSGSATASGPAPSSLASPAHAASDDGGYVGSGGTDPRTGLQLVETDDLPVEARRTLVRIDAGGPFPYPQDGSTFHNLERILPIRPDGYYTEYTVPTPGSEDRGARRIVAGERDDYFYTPDHYSTFARIIR